MGEGDRLMSGEPYFRAVYRTPYIQLRVRRNAGCMQRQHRRPKAVCKACFDRFEWQATRAPGTSTPSVKFSWR